MNKGNEQAFPKRSSPSCTRKIGGHQPHTATMRKLCFHHLLRFPLGAISRLLTCFSILLESAEAFLKEKEGAVANVRNAPSFFVVKGFVRPVVYFQRKFL